MDYLKKKQGAHILDRAKELRKTMSLPEVLLWQALRPKFNKEFRLRRQKPILERYVIDFYFAPTRIAFEIDGRAFHEERFEIDEQRDHALAKIGISTIRIPAQSVLEDVNHVASFIHMICSGEIQLSDLDPHTIQLATTEIPSRRRSGGSLDKLR